ncbi:hypothetical protein [Demequina sp. NBRC 110053]|uniref:hypothetical protein n=1 Tax=Demequina sp. NBRC 110053 TaxID=1570342 RepID=UPI001F2A3BEB|nr:hypothetical protein [Demequina sp. NBRC 110053]
MSLPSPAHALDAARPSRREGLGRGPLPKYPASRLARWALRLAFAVPFLVISAALAADPEEYFSTATPNAALVDQVSALSAAPADVDILVRLYPPVTSVTALLVPGGAVGLAIVGSLIAGFFLQRVLEWLRRQDYGWPERVVLLLMLGATPLFAANVTTNLEITLALALFGLGLVDVVRFIVFANTQAGFRAGILFALAALSAPAFLFSIVIAGCVVPFLVHSRRGARLANAFVIVFPTVAAFGAVSVLGLVFRSDLLFVFGGQGLQFDLERALLVRDVLTGPWGWLYFAPAVAGVAFALAVRRPLLALMPPLVTASILLSVVLGATPSGSAGVTFLLLLTIGIALLPRRPRGGYLALVIGLAVSQAVVAWVTAFVLYPASQDWMDALARGWPS